MDFELRKTPLLTPLPTMGPPAPVRTGRLVAWSVLKTGLMASAMAGACHMALFMVAGRMTEAAANALYALLSFLLAYVVVSPTPAVQRRILQVFLTMCLVLVLAQAVVAPQLWEVWCGWAAVVLMPTAMWLGTRRAGLMGAVSCVVLGAVLVWAPASDPLPAWLVLGMRAVGLVGMPATLVILTHLTMEELSLSSAAMQQSLATMARAERMAGLGVMVAGVAHEVNNPLTYVLANLGALRDMMAGGTCSPEQTKQGRELVGDALHGAERMASLVQQLKGFARGEREPARPLGLRHVVADGLRFVMPEVGRRARVDNQVASDGVVPDGNAVMQVLMNLVVNAAHAVEDHPAPATGHLIRLRSHAASGDPTRVQLDVEDTGPGVPADLRERIFEPFFTTRSGGGGTGLGLAICQDTLHRLGGHIEVGASADLGGARFSVTLPCARALGHPLTPLSSTPIQGTAIPGRGRPRVLLVDDEPRVLTAMARLLPDVDVLTAPGGAQALESIRAQSFALILCDVNMPGVDGPEVLRQLRSHNPGQADRLVFMTGGAVAPNDPALGGAQVLYKPIGRLALHHLLAERGLLPAPVSPSAPPS